jgi:hypothetical protein
MLVAHDEAELARAISRAGEQPGAGLFVLPDSSNIVHRELIIRLAAEYRLSAIYYFRYFATDGGLISYGHGDQLEDRQGARPYRPAIAARARR